MSNWINLAKVADLPPGAKICDRGVVLANVAGAFHAIKNVCPHAGLPLGDGDLDGPILTCPHHGFAYKIDTGHNCFDPDEPPVGVLPVRVEGDWVQVDIQS